MKLYIALILSCLIALSASYGADKNIFQIKDPRGDDHGDGTIILPTTGELRFGDLDILSFSATAQEDGTMFKVEFANPIERPDTRSIDSGGMILQNVAKLGFFRFNIDIYIDIDRKLGSGLTNTLPGRNALIDPAFAWERAICLTPQPNETRSYFRKILISQLEDKLKAGKGRVDPEDDSKISADAAADLDGTYYFPDRVRVNSRVISFFVPASFLGGVAKADWGYVLIVTVATLDKSVSIGNYLGAQTGDTLGNLPINAGSWSDRLGTTRREDEAALLPPIIDMLVPQGKKQEEVLRNFNVNTKQQVVLPAVVPAEPQKKEEKVPRRET